MNRFKEIIIHKSTPTAGILLSTYILYLTLTDKITFYIHPDYKVFAGIMSLIFFLVSLYGLFSKDKDSHAHNHSHEHSLLKGNVIIPVFIVFLIGVLLPPTALTSNTANRRGIDNSSANFARNTDDIKISSSFGQDTRTFDIGTWIKSFSVDPEPTNYTGKKVNVTGFFHKPEDTPKDLFYISRYVITCCSVDARPVGIYVEEGNYNFKENDWLEVDGEFDAKKLDNGKQAIVIKPNNVKFSNKPNNPYIY